MDRGVKTSAGRTCSEQNHNKMQSKKADFASVSPPGELDETYALALTLAHSLHYLKTRRYPQNRKYMTYCIVVRGGPSHGHSNMYIHFGEIRL